MFWAETLVSRENPVFRPAAEIRAKYTAAGAKPGTKALRTKLKAIRPDIPVLLFAGVGRQTPFMLPFFDAYLRNTEQVGDGLGDLEV